MDRYSEITNLVNSDKLELSWVIGPPRTGGNALHLALAQARKVTAQLNEPFQVLMGMPERKYKLYACRAEGENAQLLEDAFGRGCGHLLEKYRSLADSTKRVHLVVHDLSQTLSIDDFSKIAKIGRHVVFTVRDPRHQALSMLKRYTNDQWGELGRDALDTSSVLELMGEGSDLTSYVADHLRVVNEKLHHQSEERLRAHRAFTLSMATEEIEASWNQLEAFVEAVPPELPVTLLNYSTLFDDPEGHMSALANRLGIEYTPDMINNWTRHVGEKFDCVITRNWPLDLARNNTWNGPARNSFGLGLQDGNSTQEVDVERLPLELRDCLDRVHQIYQRVCSMMADRMA